jgi:hypothetical protein
VREIAITAGVALGTASRVLRALDRLGVLRTKRAGRALQITVADPPRLFALWTDRYEWTRNDALALAAPIADSFDFLPRLEGAIRRAAPSVRHAFTLQAGATLVASHADWDRIHA